MGIQMICAIHQPNFIPWMPYFEKIKQVDKFIILRYCKFRKNDYQNRFNLNDQWYTMSVEKKSCPILIKKYNNHERDWEKIKRGLAHKYSVLNQFDSHITKWVAETNINIIRHICKLLNIQTMIILDKQTHFTSTDRLIEICKDVGATEYLAGIMGKKYLNLLKFNKEGIKVRFQQINNHNHILEEL
jgi:hypothetical protein